MSLPNAGNSTEHSTWSAINNNLLILEHHGRRILFTLTYIRSVTWCKWLRRFLTCLNYISHDPQYNQRGSAPLAYVLRQRVAVNGEWMRQKKNSDGDDTCVCATSLSPWLRQQVCVTFWTPHLCLSEWGGSSAHFLFYLKRSDIMK